MLKIVVSVLFLIVAGCDPCKDVYDNARREVLDILHGEGYSNIEVVRESCNYNGELIMNYYAERQDRNGILFVGEVSCVMPIRRCSILEEAERKILRKKGEVK